MVSKDTIPDGVLFTETHEYLLLEGDGEDRARVGISDHAAEQLGDIVYVELPAIGEHFEKGDTFGSIESVKAASDLYMPVSGEIVAINTQLTDEPGLINDDSYGDGWMIEIATSNASEQKDLQNKSQYIKFVEDSKD